MVVVNGLTRVWSGWEQDLEIVQDKGRTGKDLYYQGRA